VTDLRIGSGGSNPAKTGGAMLQSLRGLLGCPSLLGLPIKLRNFQSWKFHTVQANLSFSSVSIDTTKKHYSQWQVFVASCQTGPGCKAKNWGCNTPFVGGPKK